MARFENVTYEHYHNDLGRSAVPDSATFDNYKLEVVLWVETLLINDLIIERKAGGIDDACCMMIEESYNASQIEAGATGGAVTSESIGGYSYSKSTKAADIQAEKDAQSKTQKMYKWLSLYCYITNGVQV